MKPVICAHRGLHDEYQENTIKAFQAAKEVGAEMIEFDTMRTKDDVWILRHDLYIENKDNLVKNLRYDEVVELIETRGEELDLLENFLQKPLGLHLNIECKSKNYNDGVDLANTLSELEIKDTFNISSFSKDVLRALYNTDRKLKLSLLGYILPFVKWRKFLKEVPIISINPIYRFSHRDKVISAHRRGLEYHVYTPNSQRELNNCLDYGVDVIITDVPELAINLRSQYFMNKDKSI